MKNENVIVLGLGVSGRSAAEFLISHGANVIGVDRNPELVTPVKGMKSVKETTALDFNKFDYVVVSPGISQTNPVYQAATKAGIEVIGEIELACRYLKDHTFVGITGTNGKTTVTLMVTHILNHCHKKASSFGNIGVPLSSAIKSDKDEILVVELSSYQIETLKTPCINVGVILNITPDHLDRYKNIDDYALSKIKMKNCLKPSAKIYVEERAYREFRYLFEKGHFCTYGYSPHCEIFTDNKRIYHSGNLSFNVPESLYGNPGHDLENFMAAYALCHEMGISHQQITEAYKSFHKPSHRIEYIKTINGVDYYNDSKGTNIESVIRAVTFVKGNVHLIAGGVHKGAPYTSWIKAFKGKVKKIYAIGEAAEKIKMDLGKEIPVNCYDSLESAVKNAASSANQGEVVLLSPGCSSLDMFKDYAHRGNEFKRIVNEL